MASRTVLTATRSIPTRTGTRTSLLALWCPCTSADTERGHDRGADAPEVEVLWRRRAARGLDVVADHARTCANPHGPRGEVVEQELPLIARGRVR
jgi:hypothetical protein